jgi:F420H(2)-dependent quinone reductase
VSLTGQFLKLHHKIYTGTGGRVGHKMIGVPTLMLYTTGRRSGQQRVNSLVYAKDGDDLLVVASNGGADKPPAWLHNLKANPDVEVQVGTDRRPGRARVIDSSDPDRDRVWRLVNENNKDRYDAYQEKTDREIPVVAITPT